jgi:hypothetical protein
MKPGFQDAGTGGWKLGFIPRAPIPATEYALARTDMSIIERV